MTVLGLIVLLGYAVLAATVLPSWIVSTSGGNADENHRLDAIVNTRGALLGVLAPVVVAIGAVAAFLNYREAAAQNRRTVELSRDTLDVTERGQLTERFTKAIEQLGNSKLDIRIGGIYALEQIAKESKDLHGPIMEILTAFLREHTSRPAIVSGSAKDEVSAPPQADPSATEETAPLRADFQAIATVLGRREVSHEPEGFRLDLRGVVLDRVDFAGAKLQEANFAGSQVRRAIFADAQLHKAAFVGSDLQKASFFRAQLQEANFSGAQLQEANFNFAQQKAIFAGAQLQEASFDFAKLQNVSFSGAQLQKASFSGAQLQEAIFWGALLREADFNTAKLQKAIFIDAQLHKANFTHADLEGAKFRGEDHEGYDALGLAPNMFRLALNVDKAYLPIYLEFGAREGETRGVVGPDH